MQNCSQNVCAHCRIVLHGLRICFFDASAPLLRLAIAFAGGHGIELCPGPIRFNHVDGIDGASAHAQTATRAGLFNDCKKMLGNAADDINRTGGSAKRATNAVVCSDAGGAVGKFAAILRVKLTLRKSCGTSEFLDAGSAARRAPIDWCATFADGRSILRASVKTALSALRLGKQYFYGASLYWQSHKSSKPTKEGAAGFRAYPCGAAGKKVGKIIGCGADAFLKSIARKTFTSKNFQRAFDRVCRREE